MSTTNPSPTTAPPTRSAHRGNTASLRTKIADSTLVQAALAGALSFTHIRDVALRYHQDGWKSWVYPLSVDLLTVAAYRRLKNKQTDGKAIPWLCFTMGLLASLAANIADAVANAPARANHADLTASIIVGMWPAAAFLGSTLLGHNDRPAAPPDPAAPADRRPPATRTDRPTPRPAAPIVQPAARTDRPTTEPAPIAVRPTGRLGDLGPRAATAGELPMAVWVAIGHPLYLAIQHDTGRRPTEAALQQALTDRSAELVTAGELPPAIGRPSLTTAKRIRRAIEDQHQTRTPRLAALPA